MLSIDMTLIIVFFLVWLLVIVLSRFFFKPVGRILEARNARIRENQEAADRALEEYGRDVRRIEEDLKEARAESGRIKEALETEALKEKARLLSELRVACRKEVEIAGKEIDEQVGRLKIELAEEAERIAEKIEKKVLP